MTTIFMTFLSHVSAFAVAGQQLRPETPAACDSPAEKGSCAMPIAQLDGVEHDPKQRYFFDPAKIEDSHCPACAAHSQPGATVDGFHRQLGPRQPAQHGNEIGDGVRAGHHACRAGQAATGIAHRKDAAA
jgi:hypothetical protein